MARWEVRYRHGGREVVEADELVRERTGLTLRCYVLVIFEPRAAVVVRRAPRRGGAQRPTARP